MYLTFSFHSSVYTLIQEVENRYLFIPTLSTCTFIHYSSTALHKLVRILACSLICVCFLPIICKNEKIINFILCDFIETTLTLAHSSLDLLLLTYADTYSDSCRKNGDFSKPQVCLDTRECVQLPGLLHVEIQY